MKKLFTFISVLGLSALSFAQTPLFNSAQLITHPNMGSGGANVSALQQTLGLTSFGAGMQNGTTNNWVAEKIIVPSPGWIIDSLVTFGYQTGSSTVSTMTGLFCFISADSSSMPGYTPIIGNRTTSSMIGSTFSGIYRTLESTLTDATRPIMRMKSNMSGTLTAGTYWVVWNATGSLTSGPWCPPRTVKNTASTGNAMQFLGSATVPTWTNIVSGTFTQGMPVMLFGSIPMSVKESDVTINEVSIAPSPMVSSASVNITLAPNASITLGDLNFVMYDVTGKEVLNNANISNSTFSIERGDLSAGTYLYKVINKTNGNSLKSGKLIIQ